MILLLKLNINKNTYHFTYPLYWVWNLLDFCYQRSKANGLFLILAKFTHNEFLESVADWSSVFDACLSVNNIFSECELLSLLRRDFSPTLVCFMSNQANLDIYIALFSNVLQPVTHMLEGRALSDIIYDDSSIHATIIAKSGKWDLMVSDL